jgi:putative heme-binding domain-containing protein
MRVDPFAVIPTKVGIHGPAFAKTERWIPTFAGMTIATLGLTLSISAVAAPPADMMQGGNVFAITCSSSFCHGDGGVGARGPSLRNRNLMPDFIRNTVTNGRSGTPMPSFKGSLSPHEIDMVVDYVMSLSPNNHGVDAGPATPTPASAPPPAPLSAQAQAGRAIFFDLARESSCAACHSYQEEGGPIGADLSAVAARSPQDIYRAIVNPTPENPGYPMLKLGGRDGQMITGVVRQRTDKVVQIYDLSSAPPVLRSFYPAEGMKEDYPGDLPAYKHKLTGYSKDEVASLIAFLKSAAGPAKDVTQQDLAP